MPTAITESQQDKNGQQDTAKNTNEAGEGSQPHRNGRKFEGARSRRNAATRRRLMRRR